MKRRSSKTEVARLLRDCLEKGTRVEIDGVGAFVPDGSGFRFEPNTTPRVFIAYVSEDVTHARRLYDGLAARGFSPWLDKSKLLPGQNWPRAIESAIETSDFFIPCFSDKSVNKRGVFHSELRYALECASKMPLDEVFVIPVRLNRCPVPERIAADLHCVDLFPDWRAGLETITRAIEAQQSRRGRKRLE